MGKANSSMKLASSNGSSYRVDKVSDKTGSPRQSTRCVEYNDAEPNKPTINMKLTNKLPQSKSKL